MHTGRRTLRVGQSDTRPHTQPAKGM